MTSTVVVTVYFVVGCGAAASLVVRPPVDSALAGWLGAVAMLFLWPFLLPIAFFTDAGAARGTLRTVRLRRLAAQLERGWPEDRRGAATVERFVARLVEIEARRHQIESAMASVSDSIRDRMVALEKKSAVQVDQGLALLDDVLAQLTLLRFSEPVDVDRDDVEDLLARIEALASLEVGAGAEHDEDGVGRQVGELRLEPLPEPE